MRRVLSMICCAGLVVGCGTGPGVTATDAQRSEATFDATADPFGWTRLADRVELGTFTVPMDYADPSKGTLDLNIARHLAMKPNERIGSLLVNPGGPGFGGSDFALLAELNFGQSLLDYFDIVAWDPRGNAMSEPAIDCIDGSEYDRFFAAGDITPDDPTEHQELVDNAAELTADCVDNNAGFYQYVGTNNSARDIDAIRQALGEPTISYLGFSYGSELGATWATLFPTTVRAAVLDGATDPTAGLVERSLEQNKGFEEALARFLARCSANTDCAFHNGGDSEGAFDRLMKVVDESPVPSEPGRPAVSLRVALSGVAEAMYSEADWEQLEAALASAESGNGAGLLALYDRYYRRRPDGTHDNYLETFQVITCMDSVERPTVEEADATVPSFHAVAPRFAAGTVGDYMCTFFPPPIDPRIEITGKGAGSIVVMGTTGDPATPLASSRKMAAALEGGRLVVVAANQHTGYKVNACSSAAVEEYLVDPVGHLPPEGLLCD